MGISSADAGATSPSNSPAHVINMEIEKIHPQCPHPCGCIKRIYGSKDAPQHEKSRLMCTTCKTGVNQSLLNYSVRRARMETDHFGAKDNSRGNKLFQLHTFHPAQNMC